MIPVLSREQVRAVDRRAVEVCGVASLILMENAGRGAAEGIAQETSPEERALVLCGVGNNGGDGFVVARQLLVRERAVKVQLVGRFDDLSGDARANAQAFRGLGGEFEEVSQVAPVEAALGQADVVVDALFGTGLSRAVQGLQRDVIEAVNRAQARVFALDVPSGLDAETGQVLGAAVRARATFTFAHPKWGLVMAAAKAFVGELHVVDIGVPASLYRAVGHLGELIEPSDVRELVRRRSPPRHKGDAGKVLVVAGGPGTLGAARLCAHGAHRAAAGLVKIATFAPAAQALDQSTFETMTAELDGDPEASLAPLLDWADAIVVGPGFGLGEASAAVTRALLRRATKPIVLDADALGHVTGHFDLLRTNGRVLLTPHPGEAARLLGTTAPAVQADRRAAVQRLLEQTGATVLLKGERTLIGGPVASLPLAINNSGNAALAAGGSGDVLSGVLAALCCHLSPREAAISGAWLHGRAAELATGGSGRLGLLAREIADRVPEAMAML
jgi:NAD(P)H-hydrate epimerase